MTRFAIGRGEWRASVAARRNGAFTYDPKKIRGDEAAHRREMFAKREERKRARDQALLHPLDVAAEWRKAGFLRHARTTLDAHRERREAAQAAKELAEAIEDEKNPG